MWILLLLIFIYFAYSYNKFVKFNNRVTEAWSGIDVQLKKRYNLVPMLVNSVKGYADYEKSLLERVVQLRNLAKNTDILSEKNNFEKQFGNSLEKIFVLAENYPDLKANKSFLDLQNQLVDIEDNLQYARRYYNGAVRDFNIYLQSFPSNIIGKLSGFKKKKYFELESIKERITPKVNL